MGFKHLSVAFFPALCAVHLAIANPLPQSERIHGRFPTPQDFNDTAGSGGDDSAALNAAVAAAAASTGPNGGHLYLPPASSGYYNVCVDSFRPQIVVNGAASLVIEGAAAGGATIRAKPGCSSGAVKFATMYIEGEAFSETVKSATKLTFENVRIDGSCLSRYTVYNAYTVGLTFRNSVLRNAAAGIGANYYQRSGYETSMDNSNRLENVNDAGRDCYRSSADLPDYNLWVVGTDNQFGAVAVDARLANFYASGGGNNHFIGAHGWGYPGGTDRQPNLRPQFNFLLEGNQVLIGTVGDQPLVAGVRLQNTISDRSGAIITGHTITGPLEPSVKGISLGVGVINSTIYGNNLTYASGQNAIVSDGPISATNNIFNNAGSTNGQPWKSYSPAFSCGNGAVNAVSNVTGRYEIIGKTVSIYATATIKDNGDCTKTIKLTIPSTSLMTASLSGYSFISTTKMALGVIAGGTNIANITNYDGTYPGGDGAVLVLSGQYEAE